MPYAIAFLIFFRNSIIPFILGAVVSWAYLYFNPNQLTAGPAELLDQARSGLNTAGRYIEQSTRTDDTIGQKLDKAIDSVKESVNN